MSDFSVEPDGLRARLLGVEPTNVDRLEKLKQEMQTVYIETLQTRTRASWIISLAASLAGAAFGAYVTRHINMPANLGSPGALRAVWGLFTLSMIGTAAYSAFVLRRGQIDSRQRMTRARLRLMISLAIAVLLVIQAVSHPTVPMLAWALLGVIGVIISATNRVLSRVTLAEQATRESLLRLELRLAEQAERQR
jgi:hypothetical protein